MKYFDGRLSIPFAKLSCPAGYALCWLQLQQAGELSIDAGFCMEMYSAKGQGGLFKHPVSIKISCNFGCLDQKNAFKLRICMVLETAALSFVCYNVDKGTEQKQFPLFAICSTGGAYPNKDSQS
jgi:hypothetical protein